MVFRSILVRGCYRMFDKLNILLVNTIITIYFISCI
jgi:hypothetical protein